MFAIFNKITAMAPYSGSWSDRYGNGRVSFVGAWFIGIGMLLASWATELWHLYFTQVR